MHFNDISEGEYRIYAGAIEAADQNGYLAALVVNRIEGTNGRPKEAFRDTQLAAGYRWASPHDALRYALSKGQEIVRRKPALLAC